MLHSRRTSSGFTLIELLLVLSILTLVVAAVAPSFRSFSSGRGHKYAATQLMTLARYARTQAVSEAKCYRLNYDVTTQSFSLTADNGAGVFEPVMADAGRTLAVESKVQVSVQFPQQEEGVYIHFFPSGLTEEAKVSFTSASGESITVVCDTPTDTFRIAAAGEVLP